jgi:hypothetical protein
MRQQIWTILLLLTALLALQGCSNDDPAETCCIPEWYEDLEWTALADFAEGSRRGAALEWADGALYALRGSADPGDALDHSFWRYDPGSDAWTRLADATFEPLWAACLTWTGGDKIYAPQGNGTQEFYEYSISQDSWNHLADIPEWGVRRGGRILDWPGSGDFLYLVKPIEEDGVTNAPFFRYSISLDEWTDLSSMPGNLWNGNSFCWDGADGFYATNQALEFWHYDIPSDQWAAAEAFPGAAIELGGYLCYDEQGLIWASEGGGSDLIWIFDMGAEEWIVGPLAPEVANFGTTLVSDGESIYAFFGDASTGFWRLGP